MQAMAVVGFLMKLKKIKRWYAKRKHFTDFSGDPLKNMYLSEINLYRRKRVDDYENLSTVTPKLIWNLD
jgi:hypothetical protein